MFHLLVSYLQTPAQPLIRGNLYSRDSCLGPEGVPWKEVPLYNFNPLFLFNQFSFDFGHTVMCHSDIEFKTMKNKIWSKGKFEPQYINFASWYCKGAFQKVRTGRLDHGRTGHFENEIGFFHEFLMKNDFLRAYYLGFDWSGWIALIKGKILITKGMSWPVSSDKWKAP